jgi:polyhydroxybutyrate depolymerase
VIDLVVAGSARRYLAHVPPGDDGVTARPLVLAFHGLTETPALQALSSDMNDTADAHGFFAAYPEGLGASWNGGGGVCCGQSGLLGVDDVGFSVALVADLATRVCVDRHRVYATGMSAGAAMAHRLGCEASSTFAAIGPVAGTLALPPQACQPLRPVPVIHFHGTADTASPYNGSVLPGAPATAAGWAQRNGCAGAAVSTFSNGDSHCEAWLGCGSGASVTLCTIEGGGHCWPGGNPPCVLGKQTQDLSANEAMWSVFSTFALP